MNQLIKHLLCLLITGAYAALAAYIAFNFLI